MGNVNALAGFLVVVPGLKHCYQYRPVITNRVKFCMGCIITELENRIASSLLLRLSVMPSDPMKIKEL